MTRAVIRRAQDYPEPDPDVEAERPSAWCYIQTEMAEGLSAHRMSHDVSYIPYYPEL